MDKTDPKDAFVLADMARCGRINQQPYKASQLFALQRLTRQRFHLVKTIMREKELEKAIIAFQKRDRRFGAIKA